MCKIPRDIILPTQFCIACFDEIEPPNSFSDAVFPLRFDCDVIIQIPRHGINTVSRCSYNIIPEVYLSLAVAMSHEREHYLLDIKLGLGNIVTARRDV